MVVFSVFLLFSQAVRTSPEDTLKNNIDVIVIGAVYVLVVVFGVLVCIKRRIATFRRLQRIHKGSATRGVGEAPKQVMDFITQEYARSALIAYESVPKNVVQEGWGRPNSIYGNVHFRRALLDTIPDLDTLARSIIPHQPALRAHERMLSHFRFIAPLLPRDSDGLSPLHYYDSAIQLARFAEREMTEKEYEVAMGAVRAMKDVLEALDMEARLGSTLELNGSLPIASAAPSLS
ncbi:unnamed protein product [Peniophora sp. CBMAI 1063]|nr:unnamed protein product [Peniophora sp. CBMAI 1063]